jgi:hypothetical protein
MRRPLLSSAVTLAVAAALPCGACKTTIEPGRTTVVYVEPDASSPPAHDGAAVDATPPEDTSAADVVTPREAMSDGPADAASASDASEAGIDAPASDGPQEADVDAEPATCHDNLKDGDETDIDCGGSCPPCALGQGCLVDGDCSTTAGGCDAAFGGCRCDAFTDTCVADHCSDQRKDDGETDVDCGGGKCPGCGPNKGCASTSDCSSTASGCDTNYGGCACDLVAGTCVYDHCFDQRKDGNETDVDCGGGECPPCGPMQGCDLDGDCTTDACDGIASVCVTTQCDDHRRDGNETDVDCGGTDSCSRCTEGERCMVNSDCLPGHTCSATPGTCM